MFKLKYVLIIKKTHLTLVQYGCSNHTNHWPDRPFVQLLLENPDRQKHRGTEELPSQDPLLWHAFPIHELWPAKYFSFIGECEKKTLIRFFEIFGTCNFQKCLFIKIYLFKKCDCKINFDLTMMMDEDNCLLLPDTFCSKWIV